MAHNWGARSQQNRKSASIAYQLQVVTGGAHEAIAGSGGGDNVSQTVRHGKARDAGRLRQRLRSARMTYLQCRLSEL